MTIDTLSRASSTVQADRSSSGALSAGFGELSEELVLAATSRTSPECVTRFCWCNKALKVAPLVSANISGLSRCTGLLELDLSSNNVTHITGLSSLIALRRLVLTRNRLTRVDGISSLCSLEHLLLQGNFLHDLPSLNFDALRHLPRLRSLYLQNNDRSQSNPVCQVANYKRAVLEGVPQLTNLDGERSPNVPQEVIVDSEQLDGQHSTASQMPTFAHCPPQPWFSPENFVVPSAELQIGALDILQSRLQASKASVDVIENDVRELQVEFADRQKAT